MARAISSPLFGEGIGCFREPKLSASRLGFRRPGPRVGCGSAGEAGAPPPELWRAPHGPTEVGRIPSRSGFKNNAVTAQGIFGDVQLDLLPVAVGRHVHRIDGRHARNAAINAEAELATARAGFVPGVGMNGDGGAELSPSRHRNVKNELGGRLQIDTHAAATVEGSFPNRDLPGLAAQQPGLREMLDKGEMAFPAG